MQMDSLYEMSLSEIQVPNLISEPLGFVKLKTPLVPTATRYDVAR